MQNVFVLSIGLGLGLSLAACAPGPQGGAADNPAEQLYAQAGQYLSEQYYGYSTVDLSAEISKERANLQRVCASKTCTFDDGRKSVVKLIDTLKDEHTSYEDPQTFNETQRQRSGQGSALPKLGVSWHYREATGGWLVLEVGAGYPAEDAGLTRGDVIVALNGKPLPKGAEASNAELTKVIRSGQTFSITVRRAGQTRTVRTAGKVVNVPWLPTLKTSSGGVAVLRIPNFDSPNVARETHRLVNQAIKNNAKSMVIDLRGNPGGLLTQCTAATGAFIGSLEARFASKAGVSAYSYNASGAIGIADSAGRRASGGNVGNPALFKGNVSVMVNEDSASCAEMMGAQLQFRKRAVVIGEPTFGVLNSGFRVFELIDGGVINITAIRTLDPSGKPFPTRLTPTVAQKDDLDILEKSAKDIMLERASRIAQGQDNASAPMQPIVSTQNSPSSLLQLRSQQR
jgi:carboxyl-terminal processing protease